MSATISAAIEPLVKRKIFSTEGEAIREILREYVLRQITTLRQEVDRFEQKYGMTLTRLRRDGLPNDASIEMHEDFVEWSGWNRTCEETGRILASLQPLVERAFVPVPAS